MGKIIEQENNSDLKLLNQYFSNQLPTKMNEYTGMFKDKNVIFFLAESLYPEAITEELTPTLYKMLKEGFNFENYYTPLYPTSTADGEYMLDWSLIPIIGNSYNLKNSANNYNLYGYVNSFSNIGYKVSAYHDYTNTFYKREDYFKGQGYQEYGFCNTSLKITCKNMHASDLEMIEKSIDNYIDEEHFFTYYVSVSGHGEYDYAGNFIAQKNWDYVKDLEYPQYVKGYLAGNIELDKALEYLMEKLEEKGKLQDTVFVISPDHWPYYFKTRMEQLEQLTGERIYDKFEVNRNSLIIYNSEMKEPINVSNVTENIDVLPTLLNLMGIEYDSRLTIGTDALADANSMVILSDYSWITNKGRYDGEKFIQNNSEEEIDPDYVNNINSIVEQKILMSSLVQKKNYYKYLKETIEKINNEENQAVKEVNESGQS